MLCLGVIRESVPKPQGIGYEWPTLYKVPGHVYYDLNFLLQQGEYICHFSRLNLTWIPQGSFTHTVNVAVSLSGL